MKETTKKERERDEAWMGRETDEKEGREKRMQRESALSGAGSGKSKRRCGDEAQSGSLVGKETTKKRER